MSKKLDERTVLDRIVALAKSRQTARIVYQKPGEGWTTTRIVELYELSFTRDATIVLTWQVDPSIGDSDAWRNFRTDRIVDITGGGSMFTPRVEVSIDDGVIKHFRFGATSSAVDSKPSQAEKYFKYVEKAMLDGEMTARETKHALKLQDGLKVAQIRALHARIYANLIAEVTMDGEIDEPEEHMLTNMRVFLDQLGWAP